MFYTTTYQSPVGRLLLASDGCHLTGLWLDQQKYFADTLPANAQPKSDVPVFDQTKAWLDRYFKGEKPEISELPLAPIGGEFRQAVWKILCDIPYGQVMTYGEIAKKIAQQQGRKSMSAQAVGGAVGHNPISLIIPCHRVIGTNGSLTGYAGGIDAKMTLLHLEGVDTTHFKK